MSFTSSSAHGLCDGCRGVMRASLVFEWADVSHLRIPLGSVVEMNESGGSLDEFRQVREGVPVVVIVCVNTSIRFRGRVVEVTPRLSHGAFKSQESALFAHCPGNKLRAPVCVENDSPCFPGASHVSHFQRHDHKFVAHVISHSPTDDPS